MNYLDGMENANSFYEKYGLAGLIVIESEYIDDKILVAATLMDLERKGIVKFEDGLGFEIINSNKTGLFEYEKLILSLISDGRVILNGKYNLKKSICQMLEKDQLMFWSNDKDGYTKRNIAKVISVSFVFVLLLMLLPTIRYQINIGLSLIIGFFSCVFVILMANFLSETIKTMRGTNGYETTIDGDKIRESLKVLSEKNSKEKSVMSALKEDMEINSNDDFYKKVSFLNTESRRKIIKYSYYIKEIKNIEDF